MEEVECPGCLNKSTDILTKFQAGEPCPHCGLTATAAKAVIQVRKGYATDAVKARFAELVVRVDRAEAINRRLHHFISRVISEGQNAITYTAPEEPPETPTA